MFDAPPRSSSTVFTRLGEEHVNVDGVSAWLKLQRPGVKAGSFIEGPVFDTQGYLWFCDIPWGRIFRASPGGDVELVIQYDGEPNGLAFSPDGRLYIADYKNGLLTLDPAIRKIEIILAEAPDSPFKGLNDLIFARNGDLYFTDQGLTGLHDASGRLFRLRVDGRLDCLLDNVPSPNGLVLAPDERSLLLAVTRDNAVWRVPFLPDGNGVFKVGVFVRLSGGNGPDGLAIDAAGNLVVCHLGLGAVWVFDPHGEPLRRIQSCAGRLTTNATFGPPRQPGLYITESDTGSILRAEVDW